MQVQNAVRQADRNQPGGRGGGGQPREVAIIRDPGRCKQLCNCCLNSKKYHYSCSFSYCNLLTEPNHVSVTTHSQPPDVSSSSPPPPTPPPLTHSPSPTPPLAASSLPPRLSFSPSASSSDNKPVDSQWAAAAAAGPSAVMLSPLSPTAAAANPLATNQAAWIGAPGGAVRRPASLLDLAGGGRGLSQDGGGGLCSPLEKQRRISLGSWAGQQQQQQRRLEPATGAKDRYNQF